MNGTVRTAATRRPRRSLRPLRTDVLLAFVFGTIFLAAVIYFAVTIDRPSQFQMDVFKTVLALAAAGVGAVLPGFLHIRFANWARAGGALALFLVVYFYAPVAVNSIDANPVENRQNPIPQAEHWLMLIDRARYDEAYDRTSPLFRSRFDRGAMIQLVSAERAALGPLVSRRLASDQPFTNPPGATPGAYRVITFVAKFAKRKAPIYEGIQLRSEEDGWQVFGFMTYARTPSGMFVPYSPEDDTSE